jgi:hypothetical protein
MRSRSTATTAAACTATSVLEGGQALRRRRCCAFDIGLWYIGGILKHASAGRVHQPTTNSYRWLVPAMRRPSTSRPELQPLGVDPHPAQAKTRPLRRIEVLPDVATNTSRSLRWSASMARRTDRSGRSARQGHLRSPRGAEGGAHMPGRSTRRPRPWARPRVPPARDVFTRDSPRGSTTSASARSTPCGSPPSRTSSSSTTTLRANGQARHRCPDTGRAAGARARHVPCRPAPSPAYPPGRR